MRLASSLLAVVLNVLAAGAQSVPSLMNYQGRLTDESGQPLPNGTYGVQFRLWNRPVPDQPGEILVWGQQHDLSLVDGVFNVILGAPVGAPLQGAAVSNLQVAFGEAERYLGLTLVRLSDGTVVNETQRREILPRQQLLTTPYSMISAGLIRELAEALCPPGTIVAFGGTAESVPNGWFLCDGRPLLMAHYPRLHSVIGFGWGKPAADQFNVPDLRGLFLRGVDASPITGESGQDPDRAGRRQIQPEGAVGNAVGSYQLDALRRHSHPFTWIGNFLVQNAAPDLIRSPGYTEGPLYGNVGHTLPKVEVEGDSIESRPKNAAVNYIIKF